MFLHAVKLATIYIIQSSACFPPDLNDLGWLGIFVEF